jgi:hypothetical protein
MSSAVAPSSTGQRLAMRARAAGGEHDRPDRQAFVWQVVDVNHCRLARRDGREKSSKLPELAQLGHAHEVI